MFQITNKYEKLLIYWIFLFQGRMTRSTSSSAGFTNGNGNSTSENRNSTSENRISTSENNGHCSSSLSNDIEPTHGMFIQWTNTRKKSLISTFDYVFSCLLDEGFKKICKKFKGRIILESVFDLVPSSKR